MNSFSETVGKPAQKAANDGKKNMNAGMDNLGSFAEDVSADLRKGANEAEKMVREYSRSAIELAKKHPVYATIAAVGAGLVVGALLSRSKGTDL